MAVSECCSKDDLPVFIDSVKSLITNRGYLAKIYSSSVINI